MALTEPISDADGFESAIRMESGRLFAVAYSILRDVQEAEDAVQETMEQAWRSWSTLRDPLKRAAWLRQICVRRALRLRRRVQIGRASCRERVWGSGGAVGWEEG